MTIGTQFTEDALLLRHEQAISDLYDRYASLLYGIILREVKTESVATSILKATFVKVGEECKKIDCLKKPLFAWLLEVTKRTAAIDFEINLDLTALFRPSFVGSC